MLYKLWSTFRSEENAIHNEDPSLIAEGPLPTIYAQFIDLAGRNPLPNRRYAIVNENGIPVNAG